MMSETCSFDNARERLPRSCGPKIATKQGFRFASWALVLLRSSPPPFVVRSALRAGRGRRSHPCSGLLGPQGDLGSWTVESGLHTLVLNAGGPAALAPVTQG